jgi:hypothetical protein
LSNEKLYGLFHQQRGTIKWVKLGDENSKFFHANSSIEHRRNLISTLVDASDSPVHSHSQKADRLWHDFKDRLGTCNFERMLFDLPSMLNQGTDLSSLETPITVDEINGIIKALPTNKSLGPDSFNNEFLKNVGTL